ncbi:ribonuclease R [Flavobacteriaceae bacterium 14752]|uniref:ribonuclease R n=1 Tax=Mesohalobacter salilacus TaxID=2491711 RepID=UPI000F641F8D|nr:ribonuclease R [Flavobacteriaceae bacterium 14752]
MRKQKHHKSNKPSEKLSQKILNILRKQPTKGFKFPQIAEKLDANDTKTRNRIIRTLGELTSKKKLVQTQSGQFQFNDTSNVFEGVVDMTNRGDAYIKVEDLETDIYVQAKKLNMALHKDIVEVYVANLKPHGRKSEGEITKIIERYKTRFVGKIEINERFAFVVVQDPKMYTDIFIDKSDYNNAKDGELVVVEMTKWQDNKDSPNGKVLEVLGTPGDHNTEMHAILAQYDLPEAFPQDVTNFANQLDTSISKKDIQSRRDMRDVLTFTIDPATAKDFDDALSFKTLKNGNHEVGIHIADVSHYLQPDTILDEEAYNRATSIYLVDRVVPMLPEILSNEACSLRPNEDKLTFSAVFELGDNGKVIQQWFGRTVTHSDQRLAYEEAQYILDTQDTTVDQSVSLTGKSYEVSEDIKEAILKLNSLAEQMRNQRFQKGAISFDKVEVNFHLSEDNEPEGVFFKSSKAANKLIEEFMLLANKKVSEFIGKQKPPKTFVYRCHDEPSEDRLEALDKIISQFGYKLNYKNPKSLSQSINKLLKDVEGKNEQNLVDTLAIRSMSKAYYSTQNIGHYGLAFPYYSHFTSPIRRYPDVMVHRLLQHYLDGKSSQNEALYEDKCKHCSAMENLSTNAERDSIKFMQVKFMQKHEGEIFTGVISGVTDFGIFVELIENKCEGMIRLKDIPGDYYTFDPETYEVVGKKTGQSYRLGDEIDVKVKKADLIKRNLDFEMV